MNYYRLDATTSQQIKQLVNQVNDYEKMVVDWLSFMFNMNDDTDYVVFNDIPVMTEAILELNPELRPLMNKRNNALNQSNPKCRRYIYSWKAKKIDNGYGYRECYTSSYKDEMTKSILSLNTPNYQLKTTDRYVYLKTRKELPSDTPHREVTRQTYMSH